MVFMGGHLRCCSNVRKVKVLIVITSVERVGRES